MSSLHMFDTRAVYGFTMVLAKFLHRHAPTSPVVVVFEGQRLHDQKDFRTALYPDYKAHRGKTPTAIIHAVPWVKAICKALGLTLLEIDSFEADDAIGSLTRQASSKRIKSIIVSNDKDFRQLLDRDLVSILRFGARDSYEYITEQSFRDDFSDLHPRQYVDVLTLIGDSADGLKGVSGIGVRTAPKLIAHYGSLEALLDAVREYFRLCEENTSGKKAPKAGLVFPELPFITLRFAKALKESEQHALLVKRLITIREDLHLSELEGMNFHRKPIDKKETLLLMRKLEFTNKGLINRLLDSAKGISEVQLESPVAAEPAAVHRSSELPSGAIKEEADAEGMISSSSHNRPISSLESKPPFMTEIIVLPTAQQIEMFVSEVSDRIAIVPILSRSKKERELIGCAVGANTGEAYVFHITPDHPLPDSLMAILRNPHVEKHGWFLKDLYKGIIQEYHVKVQGKLFDMRIAAELLHAGEKVTDSKLASLYMRDGIFDSLIPDTHHRITTPHSDSGAALLCGTALQFSAKLEKTLCATNLDTILHCVELPLIPVLGDMEITGVPVDVASLSEYEKFVRSRVEAIESAVQELVLPFLGSAEKFRASSRDDVARLLFETWKVNTKMSRTKAGKYSVSKQVLSAIANDGRLEEHMRNFASLMLEHREASKILNTYTASLISAVLPDGRIRCTFNQEAASTGRLSTAKPNLQSLPIRSALGRKIRGMVKAPEGFSILCADYSQIEMRIMASLCGDKNLCYVLSSGEDIHKYVASTVFNVSEQEVTEVQRKKAKEVNYGIWYGISAYGLGQQLQIPTRDAQELISQFHIEFPLVKDLTQELVEKAKRDGYAETILGRRLSLPLLIHGGPQERKAAARVAVNMPIQGTQADMMKVAMVRIAERLHSGNAASKLILQLHDELVVQVENSELDDVVKVVEEEMIMALPLNGMEVVVNTGVGPSWLHAAAR